MNLKSSNPLVSVVVTTRNEEANIANCLESVAYQTYPNLELIVVDNNSTDKTKEIANRFTKLVFNLGPERSAQRNFGMLEKANGKYLMYLDADMVISDNLIQDCVDMLENSEAIALYINEIVLGETLFARIRRFERQFYTATAVDATRFIDSRAFKAVGGFDQILFEKGSGEDWDLDNSLIKMGTFLTLPKMNLDSNSSGKLMKLYPQYCLTKLSLTSGIYHDEGSDTLFEYLAKKQYYATGFAGYINKWGRADPRVRKQFSIYYRLLGVFLENKKWKIMIRNPIMFSLMLTLRLLVGFSTVYLLRKIEKR